MPALGAQVHGPKAVMLTDKPPTSGGKLLKRSSEVHQAGVSLTWAASMTRSASIW